MQNRELILPSSKKLAKRLGSESTRLLIATGGVAAVTAVIFFCGLDANFSNLSLFYLLFVLFCALYLGRLAAIWASVISFFSVNWFFVSPRYTLTVANPNEWLALCVFLLTAMVTGQLTAMLKSRVSEAKQSQRDTEALADASWAIASLVNSTNALKEVATQIARIAPVEIFAIAVVNDDGEPLLKFIETSEGRFPEGRCVSSEQLSEGTVRARVTYLLTNDSDDRSSSERILPVQINGKRRGAVYLRTALGTELSEQQNRVVRSLLNHATVVVQRDALMKEQAQAAALADADKLKTALLSMVSHDFRSPLTSIKAAVSTLQSEGAPFDPDTFSSLCQTIEQETDRLNNMVGNILDLSRLESNAWRPHKEPFSAQELIGMALGNFSSESNSRINVHIDDEISELLIDPVQIVQVLKNLVENALKYSTEKVDIQVSSSAELVLIQVRDRGRGLPPGDENQIFQPFYRAPDLYESSVPGLGIGLAVCRGLVEAHGGQLLASRRDGGGTIFSVTLPAFADAESIN